MLSRPSGYFFLFVLCLQAISRSLPPPSHARTGWVRKEGGRRRATHVGVVDAEMRGGRPVRFEPAGLVEEEDGDPAVGKHGLKQPSQPVLLCQHLRVLEFLVAATRRVCVSVCLCVCLSVFVCMSASACLCVSVSSSECTRYQRLCLQRLLLHHVVSVALWFLHAPLHERRDERYKDCSAAP